MRYTMTFPEALFNALQRHLFHDDSVEQAAIVYCKLSRTEQETRFLVKEVQPITSGEIEEQTKLNIRVPYQVHSRAFQKAANQQYCFFWVHSHPGGFLKFSEVDDREEPELFKPAYIRVPGLIHGSLLMNQPDSITGRVWLRDDAGDVQAQHLDTIRVIGPQYKFFFPENRTDYDLSAYDRNVRAFGKDMQILLRNLHVGVVGASGTGSPMIEQLTRLGVGTISIYDDDTLSDSNVTRIHGSTMYQVGELKVDVMNRMVEEIGLGTVVRRFPSRISDLETAKSLRDCDFIFGCTDDHLGRSILSEIALRYYIPVIDMGIVIDSTDQVLESIRGRVTIVQPGYSCLLCSRIVDPKRISLETKTPEEREGLVNEGYAHELQEADPAVIAYTTLVSSLAVAEMINKLTGITREQDTSEILYDFCSHSLHKVLTKSKKTCMCGQEDVLGSGDSALFLNMVW